MCLSVGMAAGAQKATPIVNPNVSIKDCDIIWTKFFESDKTISQVLGTIKMEGLFETADTTSGVVYGYIKPFTSI
jgi:hypothetical protein